MQVVCISDTHNHHQLLDGLIPEGDMLIHAGDIAIHGSIAEIQDFVDWFSQQPHQYKIFIAGNHDRALEQQFAEIKIPSNVYYLENQAIEIAGLTIWGSPVSPPFRSLGFMWDDARRAALYPSIPKPCDIIINHSPPLGQLDLIEEGRHVGCAFLAQRIAEINPSLVVFGHIHEGYGQTQVATTTFVNASIMSRRYQPLNLPIVIEI
jgi:Icc-related predicted phosphoesterase